MPVCQNLKHVVKLTLQEQIDKHKLTHTYG